MRVKLVSGSAKRWTTLKKLQELPTTTSSICDNNLHSPRLDEGEGSQCKSLAEISLKESKSEPFYHKSKRYCMNGASPKEHHTHSETWWWQHHALGLLFFKWNSAFS
ncbi:hypothetical protein ILYODFUR_020593 [Ilyodon furcidens]|uniref:Uncharacterized protein n=1 Tax=Ilyodon furcidens TaxID=33524 RepID=A0ABV0T063_9TELE